MPYGFSRFKRRRLPEPPRLIAGHTYRGYIETEGFYVISLSGRGRNRSVTYHETGTPGVVYTVKYRDLLAHVKEDITHLVAHATISTRIQTDEVS